MGQHGMFIQIIMVQGNVQISREQINVKDI